MAEMPLVPFAPAVAAAIYDATGAWLNELPMTPERMLAAITAARERTTATAESLVASPHLTVSRRRAGSFRTSTER